MVLFIGEFREATAWFPAEALTGMQIDDRDPALHPCERPRLHPIWPLPGQTVADRLPR